MPAETSKPAKLSPHKVSYKVWVCVEEFDEENDTYEDIDLPFGGVREFDNEHDARAFADLLQDAGECIEFDSCDCGSEYAHDNGEGMKFVESWRHRREYNNMIYGQWALVTIWDIRHRLERPFSPA